MQNILPAMFLCKFFCSAVLNYRVNFYSFDFIVSRDKFLSHSQVSAAEELKWQQFTKGQMKRPPKLV